MERSVRDLKAIISSLRLFQFETWAGSEKRQELGDECTREAFVRRSDEVIRAVTPGRVFLRKFNA